MLTPRDAIDADAAVDACERAAPLFKAIADLYAHDIIRYDAMTPPMPDVGGVWGSRY